MWNSLKKHLEEYPERLKVARVLVENGLSAREGKVYLNQIEIPPVRIARVAGVDRLTVNETLKAIKANRELRVIFEELRSARHSLKEIAKHLNLGVVEIEDEWHESADLEQVISISRTIPDCVPPLDETGAPEAEEPHVHGVQIDPSNGRAYVSDEGEHCFYESVTIVVPSDE